jgi:hypothetical protein
MRIEMMKRWARFSKEEMAWAIKNPTVIGSIHNKRSLMKTLIV